MNSVTAVFISILVPMAMALSPKAKVPRSKERLYSCDIKMELKQDKKLIDSLSANFTADASVGEKGATVLERKFGKKNLKVTAWSFNDYNLNFTYELSNRILPTGISWQTDAPTIQTWGKNGTIHPPKLKEPIVIEDFDRRIEDDLKVNTHVRCDKLRSVK